MLRLLVVLSLLTSSAFADEMLEAKLRERGLIIANGYTSALKEANNPGTPAYFLAVSPESLITDLDTLATFPSARVAQGSWSGFYWPNYVGGLGFRYRDPHFPKGKWSRSLEYVTKRPSHTIASELLSPAEKYDVLMGISPEESGSLTAHQWNLAREEFRTTGKVATWQGICNGWAAASILLPFPSREVVMTTTRGQLTFTTDDMKALGSVLYANGKFESSFVGQRCYTDEPETETDGFFGRSRVSTPECFDVNPADWHLIVTHELGMNKKPFIIDYIHDSEVWNKPVISYDTQYFDLKDNNRTSHSFLDVIRPSQNVSRYRRFRNPNTVNVVGVNMTVVLLFGADSEDSGVNETKTVVYQYALELDAENRIIGGEWYSEKHPDFAWKPRFAGLPASDGDALVSGLAVNPWETGLNASWRNPALQSNKHGAPLPAVVKFLFESATGTVLTR